MYVGRYQSGQDVPLHLLTTNASGTPVLPDAPPTLDVWTGGSKVLRVLMPILDRYRATGLFCYPLFLARGFPAGQYQVEYRWQSGSYFGLAEDQFELIAGGHSDGTVRSLYAYQRPQAQFIVQALASGTLAAGRNPSV